MTHNICDCQCGPRIDLDEQLLQERQTWKEKYHCLQRQLTTDINNLKEQIYAQCANLMQKQFSNKEAQHNKIVNSKNNEIKDLIARVITLESKIKVLQRQKQLLKDQIKELERQLSTKDDTIANINSKIIKNQRQLQIKYQDQIQNLKKKYSGKGNGELQRLITQNQFLKQKIRQFERKYQHILPEIDKLKLTLASKVQHIEKLEDQLEKSHRDSKKKYQDLESQHDQISKKYKEVKDNIPKLNLRIEELKKELEQSKKNKKQIKVEPVYIDRPIEVQKVVQKIVQVQKVVKQYVQAPHHKDLQEQNMKLIQQLSSLSKHVSQIEISINQYEQCLKQHQDNAKKYKQERQRLVKKIEQQNDQIDSLHQHIHNRHKPTSGRNPQAQKIIINVKNDGTYHKTTQKIPNKTQTKATYAKKK